MLTLSIEIIRRGPTLANFQEFARTKRSNAPFSLDQRIWNGTTDMSIIRLTDSGPATTPDAAGQKIPLVEKIITEII